jgi:hypothetical protein
MRTTSGLVSLSASSDSELGRIRITGLGPWRRLKGSLCIAVEYDFQRKVLPLLRLFWPNLVEAPNRDAWDRKGIDLLDWVEEGPFPCAVQCKGFHVKELGRQQIAQVLKSIQAFRDSDADCREYIVLCNREGGSREFFDTVRAVLDGLVRDGRVEAADVWDINKFLSLAAQRIAKRLIEALRKESALRHSRLTSLFRFGRVHVRDVPVQEEKLHFRRYQPCLLEPDGEGRTCDVASELVRQADARWTLLTGVFGTGKTTTSLHAVLDSGKTIIYGACGGLDSERLASSTNALLTQLLSGTQAFDDFEDADRKVVEDLAGPTLGKLLRRDDSEYAILLDALDENVTYAHAQGLQRLSNQLSELKCPIVLTTRKEHFETLFGDFSLAFNELGEKNAPARHARHLRLLPWTEIEVAEFVRRAMVEAEGQERSRLADLRASIEDGSGSSFYGDLLSNPLFVQFILEDVAAEGLRSRSRAQLVADWAARKIRRDLERRPTPALQALDAEEVVANMFGLMEDVAADLTQQEQGGVDLLDHLPASRVVEFASNRFGQVHPSCMDILLTSLLSPVSERRMAKLDIAFAFRALQEYFLASYLVRKGPLPAGYPESVRVFYGELSLG